MHHPPLQLVDGELLEGLRALLDHLDEVRPTVVLFSSADSEFFLMHGDVELLAGFTPPAPSPGGSAERWRR